MDRDTEARKEGIGVESANWRSRKRNSGSPEPEDNKSIQDNLQQVDMRSCEKELGGTRGDIDRPSSRAGEGGACTAGSMWSSELPASGVARGGGPKTPTPDIVSQDTESRFTEILSDSLFTDSASDDLPCY